MLRNLRVAMTAERAAAAAAGAEGRGLRGPDGKRAGRDQEAGAGLRPRRGAGAGGAGPGRRGGAPGPGGSPARGHRRGRGRVRRATGCSCPSWWARRAPWKRAWRWPRRRSPAAAAQAASFATVAIGTVAGDIHSIGKNLVGALLTAAGATVLDLGINVPVERFLAEAQEHRPQVLAMSALLTTTAPEQRKVIERLGEAGLRETGEGDRRRRGDLGRLRRVDRRRRLRRHGPAGGGAGAPPGRQPGEVAWGSPGSSARSPLWRS